MMPLNLYAQCTAAVVVLRVWSRNQSNGDGISMVYFQMTAFCITKWSPIGHTHASGEANGEKQADILVCEQQVMHCNLGLPPSEKPPTGIA